MERDVPSAFLRPNQARRDVALHLPIPKFGVAVFLVLVKACTMKATVDEVSTAALALPSEARAELAERLAASLTQPADPALKRRQLAEVRRRREEVLSGRVGGVPSGQVLQEVADLLR